MQITDVRLRKVNSENRMKAVASVTFDNEFVIHDIKATENKEGVFRCYDPSLFIEEIQKAKQESDYVVALIHWGKEQSHNLEQVQIDTGKK